MITKMDYIKLILRKVSFDMTLFEKELDKAINWLPMEEAQQLKIWCYQEFDPVYFGFILNRCFAALV